MMRWLIRLGLAALLGVLAAGGGALYAWMLVSGPGPLPAPRTVVLPRGGGVEGVARTLEGAGVVQDGQLFMAAVGLLGGKRPLKAGEYAFPAAISALDVMKLLQEGRTVVRRLTVPEGLTTAQVMALVAGTEALDGPLPTPPPAQGELLPETYNFAWGDSRAGMIQRMRRAMSEQLAEIWEKRAPDLPLRSAREALILASIVEKETGLESERARVAAVFLNRLKRGMKLQSDPTVIFAVTDGEAPLGRELTRADLERPSPYNTYAVAGLPPGPIGNPGRASLLAVTRPAATDALYFVADGTGGHAFAATLEEHNRNVARWRRLQRERGG